VTVADTLSKGVKVVSRAGVAEAGKEWLATGKCSTQHQSELSQMVGHIYRGDATNTKQAAHFLRIPPPP